MTTKRKTLAKRSGKARSSVARGSAWAALWTSYNRLDGLTIHLIHENGVPALFSNRRFARNFIRAQYGYIATRADLRAEPHGWRLPKAVKVSVLLYPLNVRNQPRPPG